MSKYVKHTTGLVGLLFLVNAGCIVGQGWCVGCTTVWTEQVTERLEFDTSGITALNVKTHNGSIEFTGEGSETGAPVIKVTKKGGARTQTGAEEALEAIEVFAEADADGTRRIGWRWSKPKRGSWSARVNFEIHAPADIRLSALTHNGRIEVVDAAADVELVTHNGRINANTRGNRLSAETHNGQISVTFSGKEITLLSHNGSVTAALEQCDTVDGRIETHNGRVQVSVGQSTSTDLACRTYNGSIACDAPLSGATQQTRRGLSGTLGQGGGNLAVRTHNGSIKIKQAAG